MALFGEKYGDEVRVVAMGGDEAEPFSVELCGGTHVRRTGDIALFKIVSESGVSAGVRRIEALTGDTARGYYEQEERVLREAAQILKAAPADLPQRVAALLEDRRRLERELSDLRQKLATGGGGGAPAVRDVGGVKFAGRVVEGVPAKDLRGMVDALKKELGSGVVALLSTADGKAALVVGVTDDLTKRFSAVDLVRAGAAAIGGKGGGGRPEFAQAGGPDGDKAEASLDAIATALQAAPAAA